MEKIGFRGLVCILGVVALSVAAGANTVEMAYMFVDAGGQQGLDYNGSGHDGANGVMVMNISSADGPLAQQLVGHQWAYCVNPDLYATFDVLTYNVAMLGDFAGTTAAKALLLRQLWAQHYDHSWQTGTPIYYGGSYGGYTSGEPADTLENRQALAMSFAVYEIYHDFDGVIASLNLAAGSVQADAGATNPSTAVGIAQGWLSSLVLPCDYTGPLASLAVIYDHGVQDVIVEIPEPATICLLGLGGLALLRRYRA